MIRTSHATLASLLPLAAVLAQEPETEEPPGWERAQDVARAVVEEQGLVGVQLSVGEKGSDRIASFCTGRASLELNAPMTRSTLVPIASVAKAMTGVLFLALEEEGLDRSDEIREWVPEWPEQKQPITFDQLVGQTHGIRHYRDEVYPDFFVDHFERLQDTLPIFAEDDLVAAPGAQYTYSSYAYSLLGLGLERVTGRSFEQLLSEKVLEPAGLERVVAGDVRTPTRGRASCYSFYECTWPFDPLDELICVPPLDMSYNRAGGYRLASADDLVRFGRALLEGDLLGEEAFARLLESQTTADGRPTGWSHGWFVSEGEHGVALRINGSNPGSWASLRAFPKSGLVVAMTTNTWGRGSRERPRGLIGAMDELVRILQ